MDPERWRQIEHLCLETLEHAANERAGFLDAAAAGDADLRREVESLLAYAEPTDDPLDRTTGEGVTRLVRELIEPSLPLGTTIGPYRIDAVLGTGGTGTVYRALDTRLGRAVALKFVNRLLFADGSERLVREARAAARLDHPNICSIYEVVEDESRCFIAMQYVEGETLATRITRGPIDVPEALDLASQIADALAEAHAKGIVHRDVKPQNIIITPRGQAKVFDFGVAASVTQIDSSHGKVGAPRVSEKEPIVGTVAYMSPEQARGQELDARTDLYSLAVVLFEMATGVSPFRGSTVAPVREAIINQPPPPLRRVNAKVPPELERIILKGLERERELRYQSAAELQADLQRLRGHLQVELSARSERLVRGNQRHLGYALAVLAFAAVVAAFLLSESGAPAANAERRPYVQLTNFTDSATNPAVSPDGRALAFVRGSNTFLDSGQVYMKLLPDGEPVALTQDDRPKMAPVFSPDGSRIAYTMLMGEWATWVVPALGGESRRLLANAAALTWIGDGRFLFSKIKRDQHMILVTGSEGRDAVRDVYVPPTETGMAHRSYASPDGRWVLIASEMKASRWLPCRLVPIDGNSLGRTVGPLHACTHAAWSPDGSWMYFSADAGGGFHTWRQKFPDGIPEQITFGPTEEEGIAMWPDGRSFASSVGTRVSSIWVHDAGKERQITSEGYGQAPAFSADGHKLYYLLAVTGAQQWSTGKLWAFDLETGRRERLLADISMAHYDVSRDGTRVVFARTDPGREGVWLAHLDGHRWPVQLASESDTRAFFGPDGTVIFEAEEGPAKFVVQVREDGRGWRKVSAEPIIYLFSVSPDRQWAIAWTPGVGEAKRPLVAYPINGGDPVRICDNCSAVDGPTVGHNPPMLAWSPDGQYAYIRLELSGDAPYETGKTYAIRLAGASVLPPAFEDATAVASIPGVQVIPHAGIFPGTTPSLYSYTRTTTHRNIYRIPMP
jgi:serine/threonine protein kinase/dipeptidyl aminopeptidase/acylaminoacyl peptidase